MNPSRQINTGLIDECYRRSLDLLRRNSTIHGIMAASAADKAAARNYTGIFGRDASICALGMAASGESDLLECARTGLRTLGVHQAPNGQIPKFVSPEQGDADFWYTGCIDATLWWLIAMHLCPRETCGDSPATQSDGTVIKALNWLSCQEHQSWHLLQQNEASDWADIMPRSGFVLYTNALWHWVKKLYRLPDAHLTKNNANLLLHPFGNTFPDSRRLRLLTHFVRNRARRTPFYLSFVNFSTWGEEIDVFGNILAGLTGLADTSSAGKIADALLPIGACDPYPVRVVGRPVSRDNPLWRTYMQRHGQNLPWQYHNGGIWPFAGGFYVLLLARLGKKAQAWHCLQGIAEASRVNNWEFNEWLNGRTGAPSGMAGQSWNAALYILAWQSVCNKKLVLT